MLHGPRLKAVAPLPVGHAALGNLQTSSLLALEHGFPKPVPSVFLSSPFLFSLPYSPPSLFFYFCFSCLSPFSLFLPSLSPLFPPPSQNYTLIASLFPVASTKSQESQPDNNGSSLLQGQHLVILCLQLSHWEPSAQHHVQGGSAHLQAQRLQNLPGQQVSVLAQPYPEERGLGC